MSIAAHDPDFLLCHRLAEATLPPKKLRAHLDALGGRLSDALTPSSAGALTAAQQDRLERARHLALPPTLADTAAALGISALIVTEPDYPAELRHFDDAPAIVFIRGRLPVELGLAIVGSRRATSYGRGQATRFARAFAEAGFTVISGGAAGIDTVAHRAALEAGAKTVAVVACGLDYTYPAENRALFEEIVRTGGAIVSEFPLGTKPEPWRFPARNRIIAALAQATLVIEAPEQSGALITARNAAEYGRDVWVVPGPVDTGRSQGGHKLIQDGAALADSPDDILETLRLSPQAPRSAPAVATEAQTLPAQAIPALSPDEAALLAQLSGTPSGLDDAAEAADLAPAQALVAATLLEMKGLIQRQPGNQFVRT